jgi:hypothetical protein
MMHCVATLILLTQILHELGINKQFSYESILFDIYILIFKLVRYALYLLKIIYNSNFESTFKSILLKLLKTVAQPTLHK